MNARFGRETWSLRPPEDWRAWHDAECVTLVADDEIGALQISAAFKDSEVLDADLRDFAADHLEAGAKPWPTEAGDFVGFEISFSDDERFWRQWYLRNGRQVLFVTYNCALDYRGAEDLWVGEPVGGIQDTLQSLADLLIVRDAFHVHLCGCRGEFFFGGAGQLLRFAGFADGFLRHDRRCQHAAHRTEQYCDQEQVITTERHSLRGNTLPWNRWIAVPASVLADQILDVRTELEPYRRPPLTGKFRRATKKPCLTALHCNDHTESR